METSVRANVKFMAKFDSGSVWSSDTKVDQVVKQALDGFQDRIRKMHEIAGGIGITIIGTPHVEMMVMEPKSKGEVDNSTSPNK